MSEFEAITLMPFKRLFLQRKNDNYQQATSEYTSKLRHLYKSYSELQSKLANERRRTQKCQTDSAIFRLDCNASGGKPITRLDGLTIERSSLPNADLGDRVVLIKLDQNNGAANQEDAHTDKPIEAPPASSQAVVAKGVIQAITSTEIRIKLLEPLILETAPESKSDTNELHLLKKEETEEQSEEKIPNQDTTSQEGEIDTRLEGTVSESQGAVSAETATLPTPTAEAEPEATNHDAGPATSNDDETKENNDDNDQGGSSAPTPANDRPIIDFKIKFDLSAQAQTRLAAGVAPTSELVESLLDKIGKLKCDPAIHKNLLGFYDERSDLVHDKARVMTFGGLKAKLRGQQRLAIEQSIKRRVSLIEGPAGSGKTLVAAYIAGNMSRLKRSKVLVCSPIQANVDKLAELIDNIDGVQVVKLPGDCQIRARRASAISNGTDNRSGTAFSGASSYIESSDIESSHCDLDKLVNDEIYLQAWNRSKDALHNRHDSLRSHAYRMVTSCSQNRRRELEARVLSRADVVCCKNNQAGSYLLNGIEFSVLVLDDVQVTSEIDCLVPMMAKGIKQVVLLSDTRRRVRLARSLRKSAPAVQMANGASTTMTQAATANSSSAPTSIGQKPNGIDKIQQNDISNENNDNTTTKTKATPTTTSQSGRDRSSQSASMRRKRYGKTGRVSTVSETNHKKADSSLRPTTSASSSFTSTNEPSLVPGGLFERLLSIGLPTVDFRIQFRMHETLSNFTNHHFYLGRLKDDSATNEKLTTEIDTSLLVDEKRFDWLPNRKYLTAIFQVCLPSLSGLSRSQDKLANNCDSTSLKPMIDKLNELISKLVDDEKIQESRIGIIFNRELEKDVSSLLDVPVQIKKGTIGDFIGQERDFIILVALPGLAARDTQSDDTRRDQLVHLSICSEIACDFKHDDSALNCALTRARLGMFMIINIITDDDPEQGVDINNSATGQGEPQISPTESSVCRGWSDVVNYYVESGLSVK